jgi:hypothetical protein
MGNREQLTALLNGHRVSAATSAAVELGFFDALADGARSAEAIAAAAGTDPDSTGRLLHVLAMWDLLDEEAGTFALTELGRLLTSDAQASLAPLALVNADPALWAAWGKLSHSIRTGETAFEAVNETDVWTHRQRHAYQGNVFDRLMTSLSAAAVDGVAASYDFAGRGHVVDVGGGQGGLLAAILRKHPDLTGTVFDQPHVVGAGAPDGLEDRWTSEGGSFFEAVPPADCYVLKWILHDWDDDECATILTRCRESLRPGGVVLVVETLLDRPGHERATAMMDLNMMVVAGGRERTEAEYAALFERAGLRLARVVDTGTPYAILEAVLGGGFPGHPGNPSDVR